MDGTWDGQIARGVLPALAAISRRTVPIGRRKDRVGVGSWRRWVLPTCYELCASVLLSSGAAQTTPCQERAFWSTGCRSTRLSLDHDREQSKSSGTSPKDFRTTASSNSPRS